jgi:two-component system, LytTR family, response regulator
MCADRRLRVLVVDDEALGRVRVEDLLRHEPDVDIVGTASDGPSAVAAIRSLAPDLVFLDVQMPGLSGVEVVREIGADAMPATIFVTAFDQYAIQAFDVAAVDYLVKPFDDERFEQAFGRARRHLTLAGLDRLRGQLLAVLQGAPTPPAASAPSAGRPDHILVDRRGTVEAVPVAAIDYIVASGPYARLQVGDRRHVIRESMRALEARLDPTRFLRIHRSVIVRLDLVEALERTPSSEVVVRLRSGARLRVSRSRRAALERWLAGSRLRA